MKRIFSMFLAVALLMGCVVLPVHAAEPQLTATLTAPGEIEVVLDATDDLSGVTYAYAYFICYNEALGRDSTLYCSFDSEYWDDETSEYVPYADGKLHGFIDVDEYIMPGKYTLESLGVEDYAGNYVEYCRKLEDWMKEDGYYAEMPASLKKVALTVENANPLDTQAPVLTGLSVDTNTVTAPGKVVFSATATDDLSGVDEIRVQLMDYKTGEYLSCWLYNEYWNSEKGEYEPLPKNEFRGTLSVESSTPAGTYELNTVYIYDKAGNSVDYGWGYDYEAFPESIKDLAITVISSGAMDTTAPNLTGLTLSATTLNPETIVKVVVTATDDASGINGGSIRFLHTGLNTVFSGSLRSSYWDYEKDAYVTCPEGQLHALIYGDSALYYAPSGELQLQDIYLYDVAGNYRYYRDGGYPEYYDQSVYTDLPANIKGTKITFTNNGDVDTTAPQVKSISFVTKGSQPEQDKDTVSGVTRLAGATRYETAFKAADELKSVLGVNKFQAIVVADGTGFADALAGSYLAAVKNAPILLVRNNKATLNQVKEYIRSNLVSGGTVYLLGGENAVPKAMESDLGGFNVKRLGGATRYDTNLLILKEAGVGSKDILVCTGKAFADSLSASAVGLPILLVKDSLTTAQKEFLAATSGTKYVIGGTAAVSAKVESALKAYGNVKRIAGNTRYETSVQVAKEFFDAPSAAVLAYAQNFPDGLCGGALAYAMNAPLILTNSGKEAAAVEFATAKNIRDGYVLGGNTLISDKAVQKIFSAKSIAQK